MVYQFNSEIASSYMQKIKNTVLNKGFLFQELLQRYKKLKAFYALDLRDEAKILVLTELEILSSVAADHEWRHLSGEMYYFASSRTCLEFSVSPSVAEFRYDIAFARIVGFNSVLVEPVVRHRYL